jgi:hypothetical protein
MNEKTEKQVNKKIAELMSWYDCSFARPVYSRYRAIEKVCLFVSRWKYRLTEGLYFKMKYLIQRLTRGYDDLDKWNAAWYIARKAIPVLKAMRDKFHGTSIKWHREDRFGDLIELTQDEAFVEGEEPVSFTEEEWRAILDDIIFAFQWQIDFDSLDGTVNDDEVKRGNKRQKRGLKLFSIYYRNLWD